MAGQLSEQTATPEQVGATVIPKQGASASLRGRPGGFSTASGRMTVGARTARVWRYRRILNLLVRRDLKVRYAGSALGYLWSVLDPLLMSLVFWLVFTQIFHRKVGYPPYILFLVLGQFIFTWFSGGVSATTRALRSEAQMVRSTNVPRELWVVRIALSKGVEYVYSLPVIAIFALCYRKPPTYGIVYLPLAMLLCFMMVLSLGLILAPLNVLVRDIDRIIPIVLRLLLYVSPVLYSINDVPLHLRSFVYYNPLVGFLTLARAPFYPQEIRWHAVAISSASILVLFSVGVCVFARFERQVLKEI
jgi:ABC-2 type transport system permease protein